MISEIIKDADERMHKGIDALRKEYATIRAGRANPSVLDKVMVEYYGAPTPINQLANISAPEARMLVIQAWDKSVLPAIEKAIMKSDLGLNPSSDGIVIRLMIPQLTAERRAELVKSVKKKAEEARVAVRNVRRDVNDHLKKLEKDHEASEDEVKRAQEDVQKMTDKMIKEIERVLETKESEITQV
ncbi:ribosome recycling factor [Desulfosporosinus sp. BICA1-9]|uniref:ribosome recycling factor n=1 Tax=Desulfosporosinus sp. BICA1-9 TaxID=1531958 RepID=UPI00054B74B1|nr:ribosome recycling factor [Desulfosporosinus sp. BICA1-9]KJS45921.1 MAG: ribosome recycling factor [Peptococcaceae bacterium BRH_c23]KJS85735.1 MAG: ribosome recycling factor [Desulfosporosinus sp. BICA1-9]HBW39081.1 ribosome recycling factor [Desulfosporosinus sp.]